MSFFLLYPDDGRKFDESAVDKSLRNLNGARPLQPYHDCLSRYEYQAAGDVTTIEFKKDLETIVVDGTGKASLCAALHIQSAYPEDIRMIDEAYSFNLLLRGIGSLEELKQRIREAGE
jgi:hypothetical protein